jgi:hypothetical protein
VTWTRPSLALAGGANAAASFIRRKFLYLKTISMKRHYYHFGGADDDNDYSALFRDGAVYSQSCAL